MRGSLDRLLLSRRLFDVVLERLVEKAKTDARKLMSAPVAADFQLAWVLTSKDLVYKQIRESLLQGTIELSTCQMVIVVTNKEREIFVNNWLDRVLLMMLARILSDQLSPMVPDYVYSFRKGRGPFDAIRAFQNFMNKHKGRDIYVLKRDISKYGDSIPQNLLFDRLKKDLDLESNPILANLIMQGIRPRVISDLETRAEWSLCLGVPSGSPLVPPLENYYLVPMDLELGVIPDCFYGRYGDDFIFATTDAAQAEKIDNRIEDIVHSLGLFIKPAKKVNQTLKAHSTTGIEWLGRHLTSTGADGLKTERSRELRNYLRAEICELALRSDQFFRSRPELRLQMFKNGMYELLTEESRTNAHFHDFVFSQTYIKELHELDRAITTWSVKYIKRFWGVGQREAWRSFRKSKVQSVIYVRNNVLRIKQRRAKEAMNNGTLKKAA